MSETRTDQEQAALIGEIERVLQSFDTLVEQNFVECLCDPFDGHAIDGRCNRCGGSREIWLLRRCYTLLQAGKLAAPPEPDAPRIQYCLCGHPRDRHALLEDREGIKGHHGDCQEACTCAGFRFDRARWERAEPDARVIALVQKWRLNAAEAMRQAQQWERESDTAGNGHAMRKERRIWNTCADELEAAILRGTR